MFRLITKPIVALVISLVSFTYSTAFGDYVIDWADTLYLGGGSARGVATDRNGNIVITGTPHLIKYNSLGETLWTMSYPNFSGSGITTDTLGNIIVVGFKEGPQAYIVKYDPSGTKLWADSITLFTFSNFNGVATDRNCNIFATGAAMKDFSATCDYYTVKYSPSGTIVWWDTLKHGEASEAKAVAVDTSGYFVVTGCSDSLYDGNYNYYTVKYSPLGIPVWRRTIDIGVSEEAYGVATDDSGNVIVTGYSQITGRDIYTVKYNSSGTFIWADTIDIVGYDIGMDDGAYGVATDDSGNIFVAGEITVNINQSAFYTVKYNHSGTILWSDTIEASGGARDVTTTGSDVICTGFCTFYYYTVKYKYTPQGITESNPPQADQIPNSKFQMEVYPNPFSRKTTIRYSLNVNRDGNYTISDLRLIIYDMCGRLIVSFPITKSSSQVYWDGTDDENKLPSGIYFCKLQAGNENLTKHLLIVR